MKKLLVLLVLLTCCSNGQRFEEKNINIGSHSLRCISYSNGSPTIVLDVGFSETFESWMPVLNKLAEKASVFAYCRAGYYGSETGTFPRDSKQTVKELYKLLEIAKAEGPFILVGHSLGAMNMELFAATYPNKVKAAVLLDPPPLNWLLGNSFPELKQMAEQQTEQLKNQAGDAENSNAPDKKQKTEYLKTLASEHESMFSSSAEQITNIESFEEMPITVIASSIANPKFGSSAEEYQKFWIKESEKVALKSSKGKFIVAEKSRHHIHLDNEKLVLNEILKYIK